jgi:hypothetical protein
MAKGSVLLGARETGRWLLAAFVLLCQTVFASGPKYVAGPVYFEPAAKGQPITWSGGQVSYYTDLGSLSSTVSQTQANALVASAASVWNSVATAAVNITQGGSLAEDVNGSNVTPNQPIGTGATFPADVQPTSSKPVAVVYDADGSVINDMFGPGTSDISNCTQAGVVVQVDNLLAAGTIAHALIVVNGNCATDSAHQALLEYELIRAFGRVLGLDWSQVNESMFLNESITANGLLGWPIMHPYERLCTGTSTNCEPNMTTLRLDDIAGINRLYPVTSANIGSFSGASPAKKLTAQNTISVQGTLTFKYGQGMQGVNVVLVPLAGGVPDVRYTVSAVTGVLFHANAGNPVSGPTDQLGNLLNRFGTDDATVEGFFDLSGVPLPPNTTVSDYQLFFEPVTALYTGTSSVGPYTDNQVTPSGTMPLMTLPQLSAGSPLLVPTIAIADSASEAHTNDGTEVAPAVVSGNGEWLGRLTGYGHSSWIELPVKGNRQFTLEAEALDASGQGTETKAEVVLGLWNASDPVGSLPDLAQQEAFNGNANGLTSLTAFNSAPGEVRLALADQRGDGRPDFVYRGRILYADSVSPTRLTPAGGAITIQGIGFRSNSTVLVNGVQAQVTSVSSTEITAVAPAANGVTGVVPVEVQDPVTLGSGVITDGLSYDAYSSDGIQTVSAPSGTVASGVPVPFSVRVVSADGVTPAPNVAVTYAVAAGQATLGCGAASCAVVTDGAGHATLSITPVAGSATKVTASLTNGQGVTAQFTGGAAPAIAAINPTLYLATGAAISWTPTVELQANGGLVANAGVSWVAGGAGITVSVTAGPRASGTSALLYACEAASPANCATFTVNAVHPEFAQLMGISGVGQTLTAGTAPALVTFEVTDAGGHPMAGAQVNFYELLQAWQPTCPTTGRCPAPQTLGTLQVSETSDVNGLVSLVPLADLTQPTVLTVNVTTGQQASVVFQVVEHP